MDEITLKKNLPKPLMRPPNKVSLDYRTTEFSTLSKPK